MRGIERGRVQGRRVKISASYVPPKSCRFWVRQSDFEPWHGFAQPIMGDKSSWVHRNIALDLLSVGFEWLDRSLTLFCVIPGAGPRCEEMTRIHVILASKNGPRWHGDFSTCKGCFLWSFYMWEWAPKSPETSDQFFRVMSGSRDINFWARQSDFVLWHRITQAIMGETSIWVHQNNRTDLLFAARERRDLSLTRFGAIPGFITYGGVKTLMK
jgi:hypothetical protein